MPSLPLFEEAESHMEQDFEAALDMRLADLRKSLQWEHDRAAKLREGWLQAEVARLRQELAAMPDRGSTEACETPDRGLSTEAPPLPKHSLLRSDLHLAAPPAPNGQAQPSIEAPRATKPSQQPCNTHFTAGASGSNDGVQATVTVENSQITNTTNQYIRKASLSSNVGMRPTRSNIIFDQILHAAELEDNRRTGHAQEEKKRSLTVRERIDLHLDPVMCLVILANSLMIGISMDNHPQWTGWIWVDFGFVLIYLIEMFLKLGCLGLRGYFRGPGWGWNVFDFLIVNVSVADFIVSYVYRNTEVNTPSFVLVRLVRVTRFGRIMRLFQFEVLKELLNMLNGLVGALRTLVWAGVLLFFPIYILGLLLTSFVGHASGASDDAKGAFGNLGASMFMVFRCTVGDCSLANGTPVITFLTDEYGWLYAVAYVLVILLVTFGIFNLIMATFVDNALATARRNESIRIRTRLNDQERQTQKTSALVHKLWEFQNAQLPEDQRSATFRMDEVTQMRISKDVFDLAIQDPDAQQLLEDLDVPEDDRSGLFDVLDADGGGTLQMDELVGGLIRLRGDPRRSDVVHVGLVVRAVQEQLVAMAISNHNESKAVFHAVQSVSKGQAVTSPFPQLGISSIDDAEFQQEVDAVRTTLANNYEGSPLTPQRRGSEAESPAGIADEVSPASI